VAKGKPPTIAEAPPQSFPEVPPSAYAHSVGIGNVIESMMQMQQSIGELKSDVRHLANASESQSKKLDRISHIIFASGVVLVIVLAVGGFFLNKIWDGVFNLMAQTQTVPKPPTPLPNPPSPKAGQ
jgi:hypothetical protein